MKGYSATTRALTSSDQHGSKHLRSLRHLFKAAVEEGHFGARPEGWLETMIFLGYGLTLVDQRDRVIGFSVVRPMGMNQHDEPIVYGETSIWRGFEYWDDVRFALIDGAMSWGAKEIWGAHFKGNELAGSFFEDYSRMSEADLPETVRRELSRYPSDEVQYIKLRI